MHIALATTRNMALQCPTPFHVRHHHNNNIFFRHFYLAFSLCFLVYFHLLFVALSSCLILHLAPSCEPSLSGAFSLVRPDQLVIAMSNVWFSHCSLSSLSSTFLFVFFSGATAVIVGDNSNFMRCIEGTSPVAPSPLSPDCRWAYHFYLDDVIHIYDHIIAFGAKFSHRQSSPPSMLRPRVPVRHPPPVHRFVVYAVLHIYATRFFLSSLCSGVCAFGVIEQFLFLFSFFSSRFLFSSWFARAPHRHRASTVWDPINRV